MPESFKSEHVPTLRSPESIERMREYFDLQLYLAEAVSQKTSEPIDEAVLKYTNFHRRFGFGKPSEVTDHRWSQYAQTLHGAKSHDQRLQRTIEFYSQTTPEVSQMPEREFGCFNFEFDDANKTIQIHFNNADPLGPLSRDRVHERINELTAMFTYIKSKFPSAQTVKGNSWLYNIEAYRRLFPEEYIESRKPSESLRLNGTSRWGQFLDSEGRIKQDLRSQFLNNLEHLDPKDITKVFPMQALRVSAPIDTFYKKYEIN